VWEPQTEKVRAVRRHPHPDAGRLARAEGVVQKHGIYNQNLQAVPPTGSISYINHSTSSIHPIASKIEIRKEGKIGRVYYPAPFMTNDNLEYYQDAYEIGYEKVIDTYAAATQHVDQGLSLTLFFKDTATTRDINKAQIYAWRKGIKTIYYIRLRQMALEGTRSTSASAACCDPAFHSRQRNEMTPEPLKLVDHVQAINWNRIQDDKDLEVWNRLVNNFWLPEKVPLSNDVQSWATLTPEEQTRRCACSPDSRCSTRSRAPSAPCRSSPTRSPRTRRRCTRTSRSWSRCTRRATRRSSRRCARRPRSMTRSAGRWRTRTFRRRPTSSWTTTVATSPSSARSPRPCWSRSCSTRASTCRCTGRRGEAHEHRRHHPPHHPRRGRARLLHRLQVPEGSRELDQAERDELKDYTFSLLYELYDNEVQYTQDLYDGIGLTEDVKKFLHYNANKALMNLGYEAMFPSTVTNVNPAILSALSPNADENHDFFSGSGSSYVIGKAVATEDDDWDF
jgi:ribonucleoside-diphosphate reductase beta chain